MRHQESLREAFNMAKAHEIEINGSQTQPDIAGLNNLTRGFRRQVVVFANDVYELHEQENGNISQDNSHCDKSEMVFGEYYGFRASTEEVISENGDELITRTALGVLLKKFHEKDKYYLTPVHSIDSIVDVNEHLEEIEHFEEIEEVITQENIDLFKLANQVRRLKHEQTGTAAVKAYLQSIALPSEICTFILGKRMVRINDTYYVFEATTQYVDDEYRLSIILDSDGNIPTLCFEQEDDKMNTASHILLLPEEFYGYGKPKR